DPDGNTTPAYTGTIHFTSSDAQAALPANYMFTAMDNGQHTFSATLKTVNNQFGQSLTARDTGSSMITGSQTGIVVNPAAASSLSLTARDTGTSTITGSQNGILVSAAAASSLVVSGFPSPTTAGVVGSFTVTAKDPFSNTATGYRGTVHFTSSDAQAILPANY